MPNRPPLGSIMADTGYTAAALSRDTVARIAAGGATGRLDGGGGGRHVPGWLRDVLNGLRPVPRGIAKALLGDPDGVAALKQAFADPATRGEILSTLAVIGRGGAGEDEILADALADRSPEIRRRAVQIAARIDRRQAEGKGDIRTRGGRTRGALARGAGRCVGGRARGGAAGSRHACRRPKQPGSSRWRCGTPIRRCGAAPRRRPTRWPRSAPGPVLECVAGGVAEPGRGARRSALTLFETIATRAPAASANALVKVASNEKLSDEVRVAALAILRRSGPPPAALKPVLDKAIRPDASPRLAGGGAAALRAPDFAGRGRRAGARRHEGPAGRPCGQRRHLGRHRGRAARRTRSNR